MPAPRCRRFTLLDAMVLVAATAAGLAVGLSTRSEPFHFRGGATPFGEWPSLEPVDFSGGLLQWKTYRETHMLLTGIAYQAMPLTFPWTLAVLALRLRRPRPSLRRLAHQPGFAACVAVAVMSVAGALGEISSLLDRTTWGDGFRVRWSMVLTAFRDSYMNAGGGRPALAVAVGAVWAFLALGRIARREPGWIDRSGRALGVYWVALLMLAVSRVQAD